MRLPAWIIVWLPKKWQQQAIDNTWNSRTDEEIIESFKDSEGWISLSRKRESEVLLEIADDCRTRLTQYILPQMRKRGLQEHIKYSWLPQ